MSQLLKSTNWTIVGDVVVVVIVVFVVTVVVNVVFVVTVDVIVVTVGPVNGNVVVVVVAVGGDSEHVSWMKNLSPSTSTSAPTTV